MAVVANDETMQRLQDAAEEYIRQHDRLKEEEKEKAKVSLGKNTFSTEYIQNFKFQKIAVKCRP